MMPLLRVCIIGGGLTGAVAAATIRQSRPKAHIELWDKATEFGGRLCTKQSRTDPHTCSVDVGAQYISSTPENFAQHCNVYSDLLKSGVIQPLQCLVQGDRHSVDTKHFVAMRGMADLVQHYVAKARCTNRLGALVHSVVRGEGDKWCVKAGDLERQFDAVLITIPVPQMLSLQGDLAQAIDEVEGLRHDLEQVAYSSRFCLGVFYHTTMADRVQLPGRNVGAMYLTDAPLCYIAIDNTRRGTHPANDGGVSVMVHTTHQFGKDNLEKDRADVLPVLLQHLQELMPHWPQHTDAFCHKWRYSQVTRGVGRCGSEMLSSGSLTLTGDAFTHSTVDGCITAATHAAAQILQYSIDR